jgi:hypothetical protein
MCIKYLKMWLAMPVYLVFLQVAKKKIAVRPKKFAVSLAWSKLAHFA